MKGMSPKELYDLEELARDVESGRYADDRTVELYAWGSLPGQTMGYPIWAAIGEAERRLAELNSQDRQDRESTMGGWA